MCSNISHLQWTMCSCGKAWLITAATATGIAVRIRSASTCPGTPPASLMCRQVLLETRVCWFLESLSWQSWMGFCGSVVWWGLWLKLPGLRSKRQALGRASPVEGRFFAFLCVSAVPNPLCVQKEHRRAPTSQVLWRQSVST